MNTLFSSPSLSLAASPDAIIQVKNISFSYSQWSLFALFFADFYTGITWVKGSNGSGKSTLLKLLAGIAQPQSGHITLQGHSALTPQTVDYRRQVFWCGPGALAFEHLTALEYLGFMRGLYPAFDADAVAVHLAGFGLQPHLKSRLGTLSTGTQRKVWLTAALCANAVVTLLDEPLNALDTDSVAYLESALVGAAQQTGRAWIVVSHEPFGAAAENARVLTVGMHKHD
jgi:ABC-type multidrug transport system ATPase subunit